MVYGIEKFKEYFRDYSGQYVFIGGTACSILLYDIGASFSNQGFRYGIVNRSYR